MKKIRLLLLILPLFILSACTMPTCVSYKTVDRVIPEKTTYVKNYWTGFPEEIVIPEKVVKDEVCDKWEDKEY